MFDMPDELAFVARLDRVVLDVPLGEPDDANFEAAPHLHLRTGPARHLHAAAANVDDARHLAGDADAVRRRQVY